MSGLTLVQPLLHAPSIKFGSVTVRFFVGRSGYVRGKYFKSETVFRVEILRDRNNPGFELRSDHVSSRFERIQVIRSQFVVFPASAALGVIHYRAVWPRLKSGRCLFEQYTCSSLRLQRFWRNVDEAGFAVYTPEDTRELVPNL